MYIYNVTVNVDESVHADWLSWMTEKHMPDVMATGCFVDSRICRVLSEEDKGMTYAIQYTFSTMADFERYREQFARALQQDVKERFGDKFVAFRTLLEILDKTS